MSVYSLTHCILLDFVVNLVLHLILGPQAQQHDISVGDFLNSFDMRSVFNCVASVSNDVLQHNIASSNDEVIQRNMNDM